MQRLSELQLGGAGRTPVILQSEATECGLACLAMVAAHHGHLEDLSSLRRQFGVSQRGATLKTLMTTATGLALSPRAIRCEADELTRVTLPAVLHWQFNHFVVVTRVSRDKVTIHDPAVGKRQYRLDEVRRSFTGIVLELAPGENFVAVDNRQSIPLLSYFRNLPGLIPVMLMVLGLSAIIQLIALATPFYMQLVVDEVLVKQDEDLLLLLGAGFLGITLIALVTQTLRGWAGIYLTNQLSHRFSSRLFHHLLSLKGEFFAKRHMGDIVSRFGSIKPIQDFLTSSAMTVLLDGIMALTTLAMLLVYSPLLASIVLVSVLLFLISQLAFYLPMKHRTHEKISASAQLDSDFMETIRSIQAIKRFGTEAERESLWQNKFNTTINASIRLGRLSLAREVLDASVAKLSYLLVVFLGAREVLEGKLTIGMLYAFMAYRGHLASAATSLVQEYLRYLMLSVHLERLADIQTAPTDASTRAFMPLPVNGDFSLQKVAFRYAAQEPWILQDFSLELSAGSKLCILGPSGCGKSTLLGLMQGTLEPQQGQILVDGYDLSGIGLTSLRTHSAGVMQQDQLMSGSLTANISFFDPFPDDQRIVTAAKLAAIHDDIVAFPMGYESVVGDMGTILSAGQHSRVLLARALYRQPRILFLDECTAHLDRDTELKVMTELMKSDITIIFITHNPGLAEMADQILDFRAIRHPQALMA